MKKIHFVTLSRSDYATMEPVALAAESDPDLQIKVIAGGSHLLKRFGRTIEDIKSAGFKSVEEVSFLSEDDNSDSDMAAAYARAVDAFVKFYTNDRPDMVFIVGDRWEMVAVVTAASMLRIPIAHHSGGDITQGSADNQVRYVLTTLSHLHYVALEEHKDRLVRIGEEPWRITVTGEPALSDLSGYAEKAGNIYGALGIDDEQPFVLATFHPTSYDGIGFDAQLDIFIKSMDMIDDAIILTAPNPDPGSGSFFELLSDYAATHDNVRLFESLGRDNYYAAMAHAKFMIGNSSSGLWEAPSFALPVVNIGRRQDGRVRGDNVIDVEMGAEEIRCAIEKAGDPSFKLSLKDTANPYVKSNSVNLIVSGLKNAGPSEQLLAKELQL